MENNAGQGSTTPPSVQRSVEATEKSEGSGFMGRVNVTIARLGGKNRRSGAFSSSNNSSNEKLGNANADRPILKESQAPGVLGYSYSWQKKWLNLGLLFWIQISMNFNASVVGNAAEGLKEDFHLAPYMIRLFIMNFLITYGFGCEIWSP